MCPGCIGTTLLLLSGASSAGGLAAFKLRSIGRIRAARERIGMGPPEAKGSSHETAEAGGREQRDLKSRGGKPTQ
jgi:hypothetical protein